MAIIILTNNKCSARTINLYTAISFIDNKEKDLNMAPSLLLLFKRRLNVLSAQTDNHYMRPRM